MTKPASNEFTDISKAADMFYLKLLELCLAKGLSIEVFLKKSGISKRALETIKQGKLSLVTLNKAARFFKLELVSEQETSFKEKKEIVRLKAEHALSIYNKLSELIIQKGLSFDRFYKAAKIADKTVKSMRQGVLSELTANKTARYFQYANWAEFILASPVNEKPLPKKIVEKFHSRILELCVKRQITPAQFITRTKIRQKDFKQLQQGFLTPSLANQIALWFGFENWTEFVFGDLKYKKWHFDQRGAWLSPVQAVDFYHQYLAFCIDRGLSSSEMQKQIGISYTTIREMKNGYLSENMAGLIARHFHFSRWEDMLQAAIPMGKEAKKPEGDSLEKGYLLSLEQTRKLLYKTEELRRMKGITRLAMIKTLRIGDHTLSSKNRISVLTANKIASFFSYSNWIELVKQAETNSSAGLDKRLRLSIEDAKAIYNKIVVLMAKQGLTLLELSLKIGVNQSSIHRSKNGRLGLAIAQKIAEHFNYAHWQEMVEEGRYTNPQRGIINYLPEEIIQAFDNKMRALIEAQDLTVKKVALASGIDKTSLGNIRNKGVLTPQMASRIAAFFKFSSWEQMLYEDNPANPEIENVLDNPQYRPGSILLPEEISKLKRRILKIRLKQGLTEKAFLNSAQIQTEKFLKALNENRLIVSQANKLARHLGFKDFKEMIK